MKNIKHKIRSFFKNMWFTLTERMFCKHLFTTIYGKGWYRKCEKCGAEQVQKQPRYKWLKKY